jgi:molybdopterin synthase catalytic subunit
MQGQEEQGGIVNELELVPPSPDGCEWIGVTDSALPVDEAWRWASLPECGGIVTFCGVVRDHSDGRPEVTSLEYEAYLDQVVPKLRDVADAARRRWSEIGRLVLLHRVGQLVVGEVAVVVVASTPHRREAFEAAGYCIDTLKHSVPIWKRETWAGGSDWSVCTHAPIGPVDDSPPHEREAVEPHPGITVSRSSP